MFWRNAMLAFMAVALTLVLTELALRIAIGKPSFKLVNWRTENVMKGRIGELNGVADPVLGWTLKPWSANGYYRRIDHGIRPNSIETAVRDGAVLAVGDSFTEGWEVDNDETWPAYLEKLAAVPIVNAGVGGYGVDQIALRAEQLLPIVKPKILIVGIHEASIGRTGYSIHGVPKPYFTLEEGQLRYHPPERFEPPQPTIPSLGDRIREVFGYSAAIDYLMSRLEPNYWYSIGSQWIYRKVAVDETAVSCALLRQLKARTETEGVRLLLFMQYYAINIVGDHRPRNSPRVIACAEAANIRVVDHFDSLRAIEGPKQNAMAEFYYTHGGLFGHMTARGNEHAATLLAPALRDWLPLIKDSWPAGQPPPASDWAGGAK